MSPQLRPLPRPKGRLSPRTAAGIAIVLFLTAPPAAAQQLAAACRWLRTPTVGGWARYRLVGDTAGDSMTIRIAVVASQEVDGVKHVWQETILRARGTATIVQTLVPADPYDPSSIRRAVIRVPGAEARELPPQALSRLPRAGSQGMDACREGVPVGWETITVPAGSFRALHVRYARAGRTADSWLVPSVPFALAQSIVTEGTDGVELVLVGQGQDATPTMPLPPSKQP